MSEKTHIKGMFYCNPLHLLKTFVLECLMLLLICKIIPFLAIPVTPTFWNILRVNFYALTTTTTVDTKAKLSKARVTRLSEYIFQHHFCVVVFLTFPCILSLSPIFSVCVDFAYKRKILWTIWNYDLKC